MKTRAILLTLALPAVVFAQEHTVQAPAEKGVKLHTKIESASESTMSMTMLINGEERGGGGGGGGDRTTTSKQNVEFDETVLATNDKGHATKVKRTYTKLNGSTTMPGRGGEDMEIEIEGALEGTELHLAQDGDKVVATEKEEDGEAVEERLARGLRVRTDLVGFLPTKPMTVGSEFDMSKTLRDAIANLQHPMARAAQGEEGGGEAGGGRRGNRGGGGPGGRGGAGMGNEGFGYLMNEKLTLEALGKLESVEEGFATISFTATAEGEGNPTELGVGMMGGMGGRGGRGGRGGEQGGEAPAVEGEASVDCTVEGKIVVDLAKKRIVSVELEGEFDMTAETSMSREGREGESMDIETSMERSGTFTVKVAVAEVKS